MKWWSQNDWARKAGGGGGRSEWRVKNRGKRKWRIPLGGEYICTYVYVYICMHRQWHRVPGVILRRSRAHTLLFRLVKEKGMNLLLSLKLVLAHLIPSFLSCSPPGRGVRELVFQTLFLREHRRTRAWQWYQARQSDSLSGTVFRVYVTHPRPPPPLPLLPSPSLVKYEKTKSAFYHRR